MTRPSWIPAWVSFPGLVEHIVAGWVIKRLVSSGCNGWTAQLVVLLAAIIHEQAQNNFSDFRKANGGPWNGILDLGTFIIGGLIP